MKETQIPKTYEPKKVEDSIYKKWESSGLFQPNDKAKGKPFSIAMPPPNATGILHIGHATFVTLQDIMTRYARMNSRPTLWVPGTDHAAIATENRVEKILLEEKRSAMGGKTKQELGRKKFLKEVDDFVAGSQNTIKKQIRKMGASCDWKHERYTLDDGLSRCVQEVFIKMYNDGLIYRGHRIVNWCTRCESTLADDEVEYKEQYAKFYYLKYGPVTIGTARPETKVLDKVIIVHPDDKRYKKYIGKSLDMPWIDGTVKAMFAADKAADMEFGSGAMTITPAHSFLDFDLAQKHGFEIKQIIGPDGKLTENGGKFAHMDVKEAREAIVKELQDKGLVEKIDENYLHNLSVCYRCDTPVEPLVSEQWFVKVDEPARTWKNKKQSMKQIALDTVKSGDIEIIPKRFEKTYFHWMNNLHDWCISRQIWFGHRIPVWYCQKNPKSKCQISKKHYVVSIQKPKSCPDCGGKKFEQDPDTLDTWFSSALWTFSTLLDKPKKNDTLDSWIERNKKAGTDLSCFHPTSVLETAYEILFFWVARMILMTTYVIGEVPFKTVYLHGLVRDKLGRKMSKSLDNGIDPIDMIEKYGADATRLALVIGTTDGNDTRMYEEKIAGYRNFVNKIWNIARFILMHSDKLRHSEQGEAEVKNLVKQAEASSTRSFANAQDDEVTFADKWIESRLQNLTKEVTAHYEKYEFSLAGEKIYDFLWHELADWYVEISKTQDHTLAPDILLQAIKLLHPFTPFVTEEIYQKLKDSKLIDSKDEFLAESDWPKVSALPQNAKKIESDFKALQNLVTEIRDMRAKYNLPYSEKLDAAITTKKHKDMFQEQELVVEALTKVRIQVLPSKPVQKDNFIRSHASEFDVYIKISKNRIKEQDKQLNKEKQNLEKYISLLEKKLSNKKFLQNAPKNVITQEQEKLQNAEKKLKKL